MNNNETNVQKILLLRGISCCCALRMSLRQCWTTKRSYVLLLRATTTTDGLGMKDPEDSTGFIFGGDVHLRAPPHGYPSSIPSLMVPLSILLQTNPDTVFWFFYTCFSCTCMSTMFNGAEKAMVALTVLIIGIAEFFARSLGRVVLR
jgi:hypothetical protein